MKKCKVCTCMIAITHAITANAATNSQPTPDVVGFKPWYENNTGLGAFNGNLQTSSKITVNADKLGYKHKFGEQYPEDVTARKYRWLLVLDGEKEVEVGTGPSFVLPNDSEGKRLKLEITPFSREGDPKEGKVLTISDFALAGVGGGTTDGKIAVNKTAPYITDLQIVGNMQFGVELQGRYVFNDNGGDPRDFSTYRWWFEGQTQQPEFSAVIESNKVPSYKITEKDVGNVIRLTVNALNGKQVPGNSVTIVASESVVAVPTVSDLNMAGSYQAGGTLMPFYTYHSNGGSAEGKTRIQWGEKGTTQGLDRYQEVTGGKKPEYTVKRTDIGKIIEYSIQPMNIAGTLGAISTWAHPISVPNSVPSKVEITTDPVSTVSLNGVDGNPIVGKSIMTVNINAADKMVDTAAKYYYYEWKVGETVVQQGVGKNTYKAPLDKQGKTVVVSVLPGEGPVSDQ